MTEQDYIKSTNRVKVTMALTILRDVLPGDDYGITDAELGFVTDLLGQHQETLFSSYELEGTGK